MSTHNKEHYTTIRKHSYFLSLVTLYINCIMLYSVHNSIITQS